MKALIYESQPNAKRIKFYVPYKAFEWRKRIKSLDTSFYHYHQKLWSIVNTDVNIELLKRIFGDAVEMKPYECVKKMPTKQLNETSLNILSLYEQKIILKGYSHHTLKSYKAALILFLSYFESRDIAQITKDEIEGYIYHLVSKYRISESKQNLVINAIKLYYEKVLGKPREYYDLQRPKRTQSLPNVLSVQEIGRLIDTIDNLKHKTIICAIYSAGLRLSEVIKIRVEDIRSDDGYIFIKGAKGKKDRKTILSSVLLQMLRQYYKEYKPAYWLFAT